MTVAFILVNLSALCSGESGNACRRSWYDVQKVVWAFQRMCISLEKKEFVVPFIGWFMQVSECRKSLHFWDMKPRVKLVHPMFPWDSQRSLVWLLDVGWASTRCCPSQESSDDMRNC